MINVYNYRIMEIGLKSADSCTPLNTKGIMQRRFGITNAQADQHVLATCGLQSCVALVVSCENGDVGLAHIDINTDIVTVSNYLNFFQGKCVAHILGGRKGVSEKLIEDLAREVDLHKNFSIGHVTGVLEYGYGSVAIDARSCSLIRPIMLCKMDVTDYGDSFGWGRENHIAPLILSHDCRDQKLSDYEKSQIPKCQPKSWQDVYSESQKQNMSILNFMSSGSFCNQ